MGLCSQASLRKLVLTFFRFKLVWTGVRLKVSPLLPLACPPLVGVVFVGQFKKPSSVCSDVLLAEAVLGLPDCLGFSDR